MRISDWSSDVCSSDLQRAVDVARAEQFGRILAIDRSAIENAHFLGRAAKPRRQRPADRTVHRRDVGNRRNKARSDRPDRLIGDGETMRIELPGHRSEEHTSEIQSLMRNSYAVFCLKKKTKHITQDNLVMMILYVHTT